MSGPRFSICLEKAVIKVGWVRYLSKWTMVFVFAWEVDSRMLKGKILLPREPESFLNIMDLQKQINREWLPISGLIWRFDKDLRLKIA